MRRPGPRSLAFDTSAAHCAAALALEDVVLQGTTEAMARGQAERLFPMISGLLEADQTEWRDIAAIGVGVGPGNFTGIRISVAAARGLALSLGVPTVPLSTFELLRDPDGPGAQPAELVVIEAPRGMAYAQAFRYGRPTAAPVMMDPSAPPEALRTLNLHVTGHRAQEIARHYDAPFTEATLNDLPRRMAKLLDWKLRNGHDADVKPSPLYIRPADAAPPRDAPPVILQP